MGGLMVPGNHLARRDGEMEAAEGRLDDAPHTAGSEVVMDDEQSHSFRSVSPQERLGEPFQVFTE